MLAARLGSKTTTTVDAVAGTSGGAHTVAQQDRVVLVCGVRTAFCRASRGALREVHADELLAAVLRALCERAGVGAGELDEVAVGSVLQPGGGAAMARMAAFEAGLPASCAVVAVNRQCASGLEAVALVADRLRNGAIDLGVGCGVESMSHTPMQAARPVVSWEAVGRSALAQDCLVPMGVTSDTVSRVFGVSRESQDAFAAASHTKAAAAAAAGEFAREIVAVNGVAADDGIRPDSSGLGRLPPVFSRGGTTTAGNASQVSDGAAGVLLARESLALALRLPVLAVWRAYAVVGLEPTLMGLGPALAIPRALRQAGLAIEDIDVFEINEAFASQCLYCVQHLGIPMSKVNPLGGAIALGHPLGATGARLVGSLARYLSERDLRLGVVSLCVGSGMGAAAVIENPHCSRTSHSTGGSTAHAAAHTPPFRARL